MSNDRLDKLVSQCKSNDVELKLDAVAKLQAEFEAGTEITDPEPLIIALKACLRIANQHLTTATLSAIPPLLHLIIHRPQGTPSASTRAFSTSSSTSSSSGSSYDVHVLRHVMSSFLPSPGVFERLGDAREKARDKARETLVIIGGFTFRCSPSASKVNGKGPEPPIITFERFLRDSGLSSKVWRVREQSILVLVNIRRAHHTFPIRPYLSLLVDALEDTDGNVRACATPSIIELFTGPGVTDAARADLKKEMTKKGVRKAIVDNVLSKLMASSRSTGASTPLSEGSENGDANARKEYIPPSLMLQNRRPTAGATSAGPPAATPIARAVSHGHVKESSRPASRAAMVTPPLPQPSSETINTVEPAFIASARDLENEFAAMAKAFEGKETEHNWAARERGIQRVRGMIKGDIQTRYPDIFFQCLKEGFIQSSLKTLASLRTTVSANTCSMYAELATALGAGIDPLCETIFTNLLRMAGFTKKIIAQQSQQALSSVIQHASAHPRTFLPLLWNTLQEKTVQSRTYAVAHIKAYIEVHGHRSKSYIESTGGLELLEKSVKKALGDPNPAVRESARGTFWVFDGVWHDRATAIIEALDPTARKQLEKMCPDPSTVADLPPTTPSLKKSSVAAAIAASRAKAKVIANAPPTLRHQATSTSRAAGTASPPSRGTSPSSSPSGKSVHERSSPTPVSQTPLSPRSSLSPPTPPRSRVLSNNPTVPRSISTSVISTSHARTPSDSVSAAALDAMRRRTSSPFTSPSQSPVRSLATRKSPQMVLSTSKSDPSDVRHAPSFPNAISVRQSVVMPDLDDQDSLLLATTIPIPDDSDSDPDEPASVMSFSTPYELYHPTSNLTTQHPSISPSPSLLTPNTVSDTLSNSPGKPTDLTSTEDTLSARAEQAQSAAERLLELTDSEAEDSLQSVVPSSLLLGSGAVTPKPPQVPVIPKIKKNLVPPVTPDNRNAAIFRQAALFKNSPMNGRKPSEPLIKPLQDQSHKNGWWSKRASTIERGMPREGVELAEQVEQLNQSVAALEEGNADIRLLQKLAQLCSSNPIPADTASPLSPRLGLPSGPSLFTPMTHTLPRVVPDVWIKERNFDRLFDGLMKFLDPAKNAEQLEYALVVVWEILGNQAAFLEGREAELFAALFNVRQCNAIDVLEATKTIRDALCSRIDPVYGLTTMHSSLRAFLAEPASDVGARAGSHAFGLIALGKFILRLPTEVLEEELPRLRQTLIAALNDTTTLVIREAAYAAIIASQLVLRDEAQLFALMDGLDDNKKNLLTYYFEKHGARGLDFSSGSTDAAGMTKLESQMVRLDKIMNTPQKGRQSGE